MIRFLQLLWAEIAKEWYRLALRDLCAQGHMHKPEYLKAWYGYQRWRTRIEQLEQIK